MGFFWWCSEISLCGRLTKSTNPSGLSVLGRALMSAIPAPDLPPFPFGNNEARPAFLCLRIPLTRHDRNEVERPGYAMMLVFDDKPTQSRRQDKDLSLGVSGD